MGAERAGAVARVGRAQQSKNAKMEAGGNADADADADALYFCCSS